MDALTTQNLKLSDALSQQTLESLENIREQYRIGNHLVAFEKILALKDKVKESWLVLDLECPAMDFG